MKKKSNRWYAKVYLKNLLTGEITKNDYTLCETEEAFVKLRDELIERLKRVDKGVEEFNRVIHVEFNPYEVTEGLFKRK